MKKLSHTQVSAKGGNATHKKYGKDLYKFMGKKGFETKLRLHGKEYMEEYMANLSKLGVEARKRKREEREKERLTKQAEV